MNTKTPTPKQKEAKRKALFLFIALEIWVLTVVLYILFIRKEPISTSLVLRITGSFLLPVVLYILSLYRAKTRNDS